MYIEHEPKLKAKNNLRWVDISVSSTFIILDTNLIDCLVRLYNIGTSLHFWPSSYILL